MNIRLLRHATFLLSLAGKNIIVDPMFMPLGMKAAIPTRKSGKGKSNPLVDLPVDEKELKSIISTLDAILITHMHSDHFYEDDDTKLPRNIPVLCQPADVQKLRELGFQNIEAINKSSVWRGININRIICSHGGVVLSKINGEGSGFVLKTEGESSVYISGDTIWNSSVKKTLLEQKPDVSILYSGGAKFPVGRSITMDKTDIKKVCKYAPNTKIVAIHMDAFNHCLLTRNELKNYLSKNQLLSRVNILDDGEVFVI